MSDESDKKWDPFKEAFKSKPQTPAQKILKDILKDSRNTNQSSQSLPKKDYSWMESTMPPELKELYRQYKEILPEYQSEDFYLLPEQVQFYAKNKAGFPDPNIGWKFHLNVPPIKSNVLTVSNFLNHHQIDHKYLNGGDVDQGKVFTVWLGSHGHANRILHTLTDNISQLLQPTTAKQSGEAVFAHGITGRFKGEEPDFQAYGTNGIALLKYADLHTPEERSQAEIEAKNRAFEIYGDFYGGDIPFYAGKQSEETNP